MRASCVRALKFDLPRTFKPAMSCLIDEVPPAPLARKRPCERSPYPAPLDLRRRQRRADSGGHCRPPTNTSHGLRAIASRPVSLQATGKSGAESEEGGGALVTGVPCALLSHEKRMRR
jgi:hypothetical protein